MRSDIPVWVLFACLIATFFAGTLAVGQPDDLEQQRALYCEMVETFKNTGGEYGWPDYKGTYRRDCQ